MRILIGVLLMLFTLGYMLPGGIAVLRNHRQQWPIILVNFFTGWILGIGWIIAIIWSVSAQKET